jgi:hypothetical protein
MLCTDEYYVVEQKGRFGPGALGALGALIEYRSGERRETWHTTQPYYGVLALREKSLPLTHILTCIIIEYDVQNIVCFQKRSTRPALHG